MQDLLRSVRSGPAQRLAPARSSCCEALPRSPIPNAACIRPGGGRPQEFHEDIERAALSANGSEDLIPDQVGNSSAILTSPHKTEAQEQAEEGTSVSAGDAQSGARGGGEARHRPLSEARLPNPQFGAKAVKPADEHVRVYDTNCRTSTGAPKWSSAGLADQAGARSPHQGGLSPRRPTPSLWPSTAATRPSAANGSTWC